MPDGHASDRTGSIPRAAFVVRLVLAGVSVGIAAVAAASQERNYLGVVIAFIALPALLYAYAVRSIIGSLLAGGALDALSIFFAHAVREAARRPADEFMYVPFVLMFGSLGAIVVVKVGEAMVGWYDGRGPQTSC